jgi:hypothetical protein
MVLFARHFSREASTHRFDPLKGGPAVPNRFKRCVRGGILAAAVFFALAPNALAHTGTITLIPPSHCPYSGNTLTVGVHGEFQNFAPNSAIPVTLRYQADNGQWQSKPETLHTDRLGKGVIDDVINVPIGTQKLQAKFTWYADNEWAQTDTVCVYLPRCPVPTPTPTVTPTPTPTPSPSPSPSPSPTPTATPTPPAPTPTPTVTPTPTPTPHHPHIVQVKVKMRFFNEDPQRALTRAARVGKPAPYGCRIVGPRKKLHGLAHWHPQCSGAAVLPGWHWYINGRRVHNTRWTYTTNHGRQLNSWLFDHNAWWVHPNIFGYYNISARGPVRPHEHTLKVSHDAAHSHPLLA